MLLSEGKMRYLQYIEILKICILPSFNVFLLSSWVKRNYRIIFSVSSNIKSNWPTVYRTRIDNCKISIIRCREWFPTCWKRIERADASFQDQNLVRRNGLLRFLYTCRVNKNVLRWILDINTCTSLPFLLISSPSPHICTPDILLSAYGCLVSQNWIVLSQPPLISSCADLGLKHALNTLDLWPSMASNDSLECDKKQEINK